MPGSSVRAAVVACALALAGLRCASAPARAERPAQRGDPAAPAVRSAAPDLRRGRVLFADDFRSGLDRWHVEQQPGGSVTTRDGRLVIADRGGCTVWWRARLEAPVVIAYKATVSGTGRVSDLNAFWMASDPAQPDLFAAGHGRDGRFAAYDGLRTYYVGCGGNANTTTRFRRYAGDGTRPLRPEHDLRGPQYLLEPDREYRIEISACGGRARYTRDGIVFFDVVDLDPLQAGWFGLRTVDSRIEIREFRVYEARCAR